MSADARGATPMGVGIIGAGNISDEYLRALPTYPDLRVVGIADIDVARAEAQAQKYGIPFAGTPADLLARDDVDLVVNITIPAAHADVALAAIAAGKHVWGEKPLTLDRDAARQVLDAARAAGVVVGNAPDTILGQAIQTSQALLQDGAIGAPQTVLTLMQGPGPDLWHPRPQFLFARGAGPLFDIGPYYVSTLVQLLGSVQSVEAVGHRSRAEREIMTGPDAGTRFSVEVWTHVSVLTRFESGVVGTSVYSFDSPVRRQLFEITGADGVLEVPVSGFDGPSRLQRDSSAAGEWQSVAARGVPRDRGVGVLEMAQAIRAGRAPRASGELAFHALDVMLAIEESVEAGSPVQVHSRAPRVEPIPESWNPASRSLDDDGARVADDGARPASDATTPNDTSTAQTGAVAQKA